MRKPVITYRGEARAPWSRVSSRQAFTEARFSAREAGTCHTGSRITPAIFARIFGKELLTAPGHDLYEAVRVVRGGAARATAGGESGSERATPEAGPFDRKHVRVGRVTSPSKLDQLPRPVEGPRISRSTDICSARCRSWDERTISTLGPPDQPVPPTGSPGPQGRQSFACGCRGP